MFSFFSASKDFKKCLRILHGFTEKVISERKKMFREEKERAAKNMTQEQKEEMTLLGKKKRLAFLGTNSLESLLDMTNTSMFIVFYRSASRGH